MIDEKKELKTIKELADELNVSKDKVKYQVRKLPSEFTSKENGITYITSAGIEVIKGNIVGKTPYSKTSESPNDYLVNQLAFFQKELEKKNNQIEKLHQLLENQQVLNKQTLEDKKQLELEFSGLKKEEPKGWFKRIFGKIE
jgi:predicted transcriptional regulator